MKIHAWIPRATYRLQFNRGFRFRDAVDLMPYLAKLGISHCYASPYLKARPGSMHGYDIVDHASLNPEVGSREEYEQFTAAVAAAGMGQMLDIVPNHMGVGSDNIWWLDVLENGRASRFADFFDIDWQPSRKALCGKVLLPVLGNSYGEVLEKGELKIVFNAQAGSFALHYFEHYFPLDPRSYATILNRGGKQAAALQEQNPSAYSELQTLLTAFSHLPEQQDTHPEKVTERERDKEFYKRRLADMCTHHPSVAAFIEEIVHDINGQPGNAASFDALHELIKAQAFHLACWRVAADDINYRRFFDVNELAGLRMGRPEVFEAAHRLIFDLAAQGKIHALRIDHPDGLYDPGQYFSRVQQRLAQRLEASPESSAKPFYLLIEKILAHDEHLPDWPIHGTTGYDFANLVNGLFVDARGEPMLSKTYAAFIGENMLFSDVLYRAKKVGAHILAKTIPTAMVLIVSNIPLAI